jgi:hypothetical protein
MLAKYIGAILLIAATIQVAHAEKGMELITVTISEPLSKKTNLIKVQSDLLEKALTKLKVTVDGNYSDEELSIQDKEALVLKSFNFELKGSERLAHATYIVKSMGYNSAQDGIIINDKQFEVEAYARSSTKLNEEAKYKLNQLQYSRLITNKAPSLVKVQSYSLGGVEVVNGQKEYQGFKASDLLKSTYIRESTLDECRDNKGIFDTKIIMPGFYSVSSESTRYALALIASQLNYGTKLTELDLTENYKNIFSELYYGHGGVKYKSDEEEMERIWLGFNNALKLTSQVMDGNYNMYPFNDTKHAIVNVSYEKPLSDLPLKLATKAFSAQWKTTKEEAYKKGIKNYIEENKLSPLYWLVVELDGVKFYRAFIDLSLKTGAMYLLDVYPFLPGSIYNIETVNYPETRQFLRNKGVEFSQKNAKAIKGTGFDYNSNAVDEYNNCLQTQYAFYKSLEEIQSFRDGLTPTLDKDFNKQTHLFGFMGGKEMLPAAFPYHVTFNGQQAKISFHKDLKVKNISVYLEKVNI